MTDREKDPMLSVELAERLASDFRPAWELDEAAIEETAVTDQALLADLAMANRAAPMVQTAAFEPVHRPPEVVIPVGPASPETTAAIDGRIATQAGPVPLAPLDGSTLSDHEDPETERLKIVQGKLIGLAPEKPSTRPPADPAPITASPTVMVGEPITTSMAPPRTASTSPAPAEKVAVPARANVVSTRPIAMPVARPRSVRPPPTPRDEVPTSGRGKIIGTVVALGSVGLAVGVWLGVRGDDAETPARPKDSAVSVAPTTAPDPSPKGLESAVAVSPQAPPAGPTHAAAPPAQTAAHPPRPTPKPVVTAAPKPAPVPKPVVTAPKPQPTPTAKPATKPAGGGIVRDDPF